MAHSLQSLYKACKTDFLCTLNLLRMVYLQNLQNVDFLLKGFCILRSVRRIMVKTCNCSCDRKMYLWVYLWWCSNVYIVNDCRILFGDIFIVPFLHSALGCMIAMCSPGWGNFVAFDWNDLPVGREFDDKFLKNVQSPPQALPPPPPPAPLPALHW